MRRRAFTIVEVIVVMAIVAVLSGFLFPVLSSALKHANVPTDTSNMSQIYAGIAMYEADHNDEAPPSLVDLGPYQPASSVFKSPNDNVGPGPGGTYPANLFVFESQQTSTFRISYAYLRSFESRFTDKNLLQGVRGDTWDKYRNDSGVGMLSCMWYVPPDPFSTAPSGKPYVFGEGPVLRIYMDGSVRWAHPHTNGWLDPAMEILFFDP